LNHPFCENFMEWINLTGMELKRAAQKGGVVVLPLGSIEAHADHLPLGNDTFKVNAACIEATSRAEPAVLLPPLYYTEVKSMQAAPGAVTLRGRILVDLVLDLCDEAARNGFSKILLVSGHGGNRHWVDFFMTEWLALDRAYSIFFWYMPLLGKPENKKYMETEFDGHGGEAETSLALHLFPQLVKMKGAGRALHPARVPDLRGAVTPFDWVSKWPQAVSGDPFPATAEKGRIFFESAVDAMAEVIEAVRADQMTSQFQQKYQKARRAPVWPTVLGPRAKSRVDRKKQSARRAGALNSGDRYEH
jgi:creatinine amidohydrolase